MSSKVDLIWFKTDFDKQSDKLYWIVLDADACFVDNVQHENLVIEHFDPKIAIKFKWSYLKEFWVYWHETLQ